MKHLKGKRILSFALSVLMVFAILPVSSLADEAATPAATATPEATATAEPTQALAGEATSTPTTSATGESTPLLSETPAEDATAQAPKTFVVNFVVGGETRWDMQQTVTEGNAATAPSIPAVPEGDAYIGQVFLFWYARVNEAYDFHAPVTENLTLSAKFGSVDEAPQTNETPGVTDGDILLAAFSMAGGILPDSTPLWTYTFSVNGTNIDTKIVANGDTLDAPEVPSAPAGQKFSGWFADSGALFEGFGTQSIAASGTTTLTARFEAAYNVFFYNRSGAVIETRTPDATGVVSTSSVPSLELGAGEALLGWSLTSGSTVSVGSSVTVSGSNIKLYPIIGNVVWISFNSNGGNYVPPMYIAPGTALTQAAVNAHILASISQAAITKDGYTFVNWSGFAFGSVPAANVTLSANWTANTNTPYKLVYWIENADDADYTFEKAADQTGTSGAVVSLMAANIATSNLNASYSAHFNAGTYAAGQTISGDGSTIVNIYFTRKTFTLTYMNGTTTLYSQAYKYDQNITDAWNVPAVATLSAQGNVWKSSITGSYYTFLEKMPGSNLTLSATSWSGSKYTWYYCLETLDGTAATAPAGSVTTTSGGITYYITKTVSIKANGINLTYDEDYFPITGFYQRDGSVPSFGNVGGEYFASLYYRRNSYSLTFINGSTSQTVSGIRYEAPIDGQYYEPTRPAGVSAAFTFGGWYTTQAGFAGSEFEWTGKTMPPKNVVLYAKWAAPTFTSVANMNSYGSVSAGTVDLGSIAYGGTISSSALSSAQTQAEAHKPHPTDVFGGWLILKNGSLVVFNPSMQVYENVELYPLWLNGLTYGITYFLGEASGTAPVDAEAYGSGGKAQVMAYAFSSVTPPAGKVFVGWRSSADNKTYYPGSTITILQNTVLTAIWAYPAIEVTITYNGNGGATSGGETTLTGSTLNNTYHTVKDNPFLFVGKNFVGWNTAANGSGSWYDSGERVLLGVSVPSAPGALYAIWEDQTFNITVSGDPTAGLSAKSGAGTYVYMTNHAVTWTVAAGYEITGATDNGVALPEATYLGGSYTISGIVLDHDVVVYTKLKNLALTYDGNGGTAGGNANYSTTKTMGTSFTVDANTFTRAGYYFLGWSTTSGAVVADPAYAPGTSVVMPSSNLTLYAVWAAKTALTLTANSSTQNYDGSAKSVSGITPSIAGLTVENTTAGASGTNPGVYATSFTNQAGLVLKSGGVNVTERYTVSWVNGALTINPQVTYRASADGSILKTEWVAYGTGDATYSLTPPQNITVGSTHFYWLGTYNPATANDLTANTTITATYSQNKTLVITADSATYTYNGTTRSVTTGTANVSGVTVTGYTVSGSGTNAGDYTTSVTLGVVKIMSGATDVTYQYNVSTANGLLTINPATTTATSAGYVGKYDGNPHGITVTPAIEGSVIKYSLTNSTNPADYTLTTSPTATDYTPGTTVYFVVTNTNYVPVFGNEVVKIDKRVIALTTATDTKMYNGDPLTNPNWSFNTTGNDGFVSGQGFATSAANGTITNVGSTDNTFGYTLTPATNPANYTVTATAGKLTVTASNTLSVSATDVTKKYDGNAYGVDAAANVPASTVIRYSLTNSTNPADYTLTTSPTATHVGESKTVYFVATNPNYQPAFGNAKVTITPRDVAINTASAARVYNGIALSANGWSIDPAHDGFIGTQGFATSVTTGAITNVGTTDNTFSYTLKSNTQSADYTITVVPGTLTVTPRTVLIAAADTDKNFGSVDPAFTYTVRTGLVGGTTYYPILAADLAGVTVAVNRTGSDSAVGTYADVLTPDVTATPAVAANYAFTTQNGSLTINPQVVYNRNTTDAVTGFPVTQWFDLGTDAITAIADGVKRAGYRLIGWEDASTGDPIALGGMIPDIGRNYELKAVWEVSLYDVTYDKNADDAVTGMPANLLDNQYGTGLTVSTRTPYRDGYDFLYWTTTDIDGTTMTFTPGSTFSMPDNDLVFKAAWDPRSSPVYYHPNGATGGTVEAGRFFTDSIVTISGNMFSRPGYRFLGWSEASATAGVSRQPGNWFYMPARQLNFYAQWEKIEYTVTYIVTGGTGTLDGSGSYAVYTNLGYGDSMPVPANPLLNGYNFDGWTTAIPATVPAGDLVIYGTMSLQGVTKDPEVIPEEQTPLAGGPVWALLNLLLAIATALASILMLIGLFGKKKEERDGEVIRETEKHGFTRMLTLIPGIGAIIAFILTENMRNPMVFTDRWTLLMVIIAVVQLVLVIFGAKKDKEPEDNADEALKGE